jgi:hypothetical protein
MPRSLWTILIPTIPQREASFRRLLAELDPQLRSAAGEVEVVAWRNAGEIRLGEIRDRMVWGAPGRYVSFIDDDDMVSEHYIPEVLTAIDRHGAAPDHVGFQLAYAENGSLREVVDHSLRHRRWHRNTEGRLVRDFTHVDPVLRDIAMRGRFAAARPGRAEDRVWCRQVRPFLATEAYVDKVLYHYLWSAAGSSWQRPESITPAATPLPDPAEFGPYFTWRPESR